MKYRVSFFFLWSRMGVPLSYSIWGDGNVQGAGSSLWTGIILYTAFLLVSASESFDVSMVGPVMDFT
jgi:hypothetical protein